MAILFLLLAAAASAQVNTLTPQEKAAGWILLFDGKSLDGWDPRPAGNLMWKIVDGAIGTIPRGDMPLDDFRKVRSDLPTRASFRDFDFRFDWRVGLAGNSGIKYRLLRPIPPEGRFGAVGFEYQVTDDENEKDALSGATHAAGALYEYVAAKKARPATAGVWHAGRIVVRGTKIEHWLDGEKVVDTDTAGEEYNRGAEASKRTTGRQLRDTPVSEAPIVLTHHTTEAWYRNLKVRRLE